MTLKAGAVASPFFIFKDNQIMSLNQIETMIAELGNLLEDGSETAARFKQQIENGAVSRDEAADAHLCVYFAAIDPTAKKVFMGHHKKADLWLFSGGHIDKDEGLRPAVAREISEEWGLDGRSFDIGRPALLTITPIENPEKPCKVHFDVWYFVPVSAGAFFPDPAKLAEEAHEMRWLTLEEARSITSDSNTLLALDFVGREYFAD